MMKLNEYEIKHNEEVREMAPECTLLLRYDGSFPLSEPCDIALFGNGARNTLRGGTGSGDVYSRSSVSIEEGLADAGFRITSGKWLDDHMEIRAKERKKWLSDLKKANRGAKGILKMMGAQMPEPYYDLPLDYTADTAIYVLSRISGEGSDRKVVKGDVLLSEAEERDILYLDSHYKNFMLVLNVGGPVDLTPVKDVRNILLMSQLGALGGNVLADILLGKSYPSGKLSTTWAAADDYCDIGTFGDIDDAEYREGIYVGYRYFDSIRKEPIFPFGYGLSYTTFEIEKESVRADGKRITVKASVTNTGRYKGREVVQLYVSVPFGKLDQPYQALAAFAKTPGLEPGESCTVELGFDLDEAASYDTDTASYILEKGIYVLRLGNSSRNTVPVCGAELESDAVVMRAKNVLGDPGFKDWRTDVTGGSEDAPAEIIRIPASAFDAVEVAYDREAPIEPFAESLTDEELCYVNIGSFGRGLLSVIGNAGKKVAGAAGDFTGLLEEKGFPRICTADGPAGLRISQKYVIDKKGRAETLGNDLLAMDKDLLSIPLKALSALMERKPKKGEVIHEQYCTMIPVATAIAQSFDTDLAKRLGSIVGEELQMFNVDVWLAPAMNIHRSILCGRNFEYYSEDPYLTGRIAAAVTSGLQSHPGCAATVKHYAANSQETNRAGSNSRVSERAMREIYLKGFGICVREAGPLAVMTSYNLMNGVHTSEHRGLIEDILRSEFGFNGIVMTDWVVDMIKSEGKYGDPVSWKIAAAGGDVMMPGSKKDYDVLLTGLKNGDVSRRQLEINASRMYRTARYLNDKR